MRGGGGLRSLLSAPSGGVCGSEAAESMGKWALCLGPAGPFLTWPPPPSPYAPTPVESQAEGSAGEGAFSPSSNRMTGTWQVLIFLMGP